VSDARCSPRGGILFEGLREVLGALCPSPDRARLSWSCVTLQSFYRSRLAISLDRSLPSCPLARKAGLQGLHRPRPPARSSRISTGDPLMGLRSPPESAELQAAAARSSPFRVRSAATAPPMRFCAPSAFSRTRQQPDWSGLPRPAACVLRFSKTSRRFDPPSACRPCFMPVALMGLRPSELSSSRPSGRESAAGMPVD